MHQKISEKSTTKMGVVFNIQRFSVHDGPGIRTSVFLKGCPLRCWWCHNPESFNPEPEVFHLKSNCTGCQNCMVICPQHAISSDGPRIRLDGNLCNSCGKCVEVCPSEAFIWVGKKMSVDEVMAEVIKDKVYYKHCGGGVTLSGGEPMNQPEFTLEILKGCKQNGIHTALDTCGFCHWEDMENILTYVDLLLFDLKETNERRHRRFTGVDNSVIKQNLHRILKKKKKVVLRLPLIPGINDGRDDFRETAEFLAQLPKVNRVELLPYNRLTPVKYVEYGIKIKTTGKFKTDSTDIQSKASIFLDYGFAVEILGKQELNPNFQSREGVKVDER